MASSTPNGASSTTTSSSGAASLSADEIGTEYKTAALYVAKAWQKVCRADDHAKAEKLKQMGEEVFGDVLFGEALKEAVEGAQ